MCCRKPVTQDDIVTPPIPTETNYASLYPASSRHLLRPHFQSASNLDPMFFAPIYLACEPYPWPPQNPPHLHLPNLPQPEAKSESLPTPISVRRERPRLYSLQEFLHEEEEKQREEDPHRTLRY